MFFVRAIVKSKNHRIKVTGASLNYKGNMTIIRDLRDTADLESSAIPVLRKNRKIILNG